MSPLFKKLNFKDHPHIIVLYSPESFQEELEKMKAETAILHEIQGLDKAHFVIVFVKTMDEIEKSIAEIYPKLEGDGVLWYCYPKASSKKYTCEFNRDTGWAALGKYNLEGVRQVAIDEDWSALRFRKVEYIKTLKRSKDMILSEAGSKKSDPDR